MGICNYSDVFICWKNVSRIDNHGNCGFKLWWLTVFFEFIRLPSSIQQFVFDFCHISKLLNADKFTSWTGLSVLHSNHNLHDTMSLKKPKLFLLQSNSCGFCIHFFTLSQLGVLFNCTDMVACTIFTSVLLTLYVLVTLILWSWFLVCSTFAIFVLHLMDDMHVSLTGPIHLQGLLIRGVERNRGRNAVYSLHSFVGTWLFWTLVTDTQRRDATLTAVSCQTRPTCFPSKLQEKLVSIHTYVRLPSFVCAFVICRSQSPDRSFSFSMINLFRSFSVMCGPSKITVSELRLDANL